MSTSYVVGISLIVDNLVKVIQQFIQKHYIILKRVVKNEGCQFLANHKENGLIIA